MQRLVANHKCGALLDFDLDEPLDRDRMRLAREMNYHLIDESRELAILITAENVYNDERTYDAVVLQPLSLPMHEATISKLNCKYHEDIRAWLLEMKKKYNIWESEEEHQVADEKKDDIVFLVGNGVEAIYVNGKLKKQDICMDGIDALAAIGVVFTRVEINEDYYNDIDEKLPENFNEIIKEGEHYNASFEQEFKDTPPAKEITVEDIVTDDKDEEDEALELDELDPDEKIEFEEDLEPEKK